MTLVYKTLGQSKPSAATLTDIYTVPGSTSAVVQSIVACNQSATPTSIRIAVSVGGGAIAATDYVVYDLPIGGNQSLTLVLGITLATTDKLRVYNTLATCSFSAFGTEVS